jgi:hypothetical protein
VVSEDLLAAGAASLGGAVGVEDDLPAPNATARQKAGRWWLSRFVAALGGTLKLIADFGDEQLMGLALRRDSFAT